MKRHVRFRFYPETILGIIAAVMFVVTVLNRAWIETVFNVDPDHGQGWVEWMIVGGLLFATLVLGILAHHEWRRAAAAVA